METIHAFAGKCDEKGYLEESDKLQEILTDLAHAKGKSINVADIYRARNEVLNKTLDAFR